jgi:hypothetical protein
MTTLCTPTNINPLNPNGFLFSIQKLPEVTFFVQEAEIPSISLGTIIQSSSVHDIKIPGDKAEFSELSLNFLVDEKFENWKSIYNWMIGLTFPEGHEMYTNFLNSEKNENGRTQLTKGYSDGTLTVLGSSNSYVQSVQFVDMFPISLTALSFSSQNTDVQYLKATAVFSYSYYRML